MAHKTRSWKHNGKKQRKQYERQTYGLWFHPYYDPLSEAGIDKRNTPFMQDTEEEVTL